MFRDRVDAGRQLASKLAGMNLGKTIVLGLPGGGLVLAKEVADELGADIDIVFVSKINHPFFPDKTLGAIVDQEKAFFNREQTIDIPKNWLDKAEAHARKLNSRMKQGYFGSQYIETDIDSKTVILVDDGMASGKTMRAAILSLKRKNPGQIIVAVPVASSEAVKQLRGLADEIIILYDPANFKGSINAHYLKPNDIKYEQIIDILRNTENHVQTVI